MNTGSDSEINMNNENAIKILNYMSIITVIISLLQAFSNFSIDYDNE